MYLLLSIILSTIGLLVAAWFLSGGAFLIAAGVIIGCLFRGIYLLNRINKKLSKLIPEPDKAQAALDNYLNERKKEENKTISYG